VASQKGSFQFLQLPGVEVGPAASPLRGFCILILFQIGFGFFFAPRAVVDILDKG